MKLEDQFESREAAVAIIGLGYVGLPLAVEFAEAGFRVYGVDVRKHTVGPAGPGPIPCAGRPQ